jgi:hypothetical protein
MTPAQQLGYKVGDKFRVVSTEGTALKCYETGQTVVLEYDNGSDRPMFEKEGTRTSIFVLLSDIVPLEDKTKKQTDDLEFKIRVLQKENEFLVRMLNKLGG